MVRRQDFTIINIDIQHPCYFKRLTVKTAIKVTITILSDSIMKMINFTCIKEDDTTKDCFFYAGFDMLQ